jgi:hypothetical protein
MARKNGLPPMRCSRYQTFRGFCEERAIDLSADTSERSIRLFRGRAALRLWRSFWRCLALFHLLLLSGMLLLELLRLLSMALLHLLLLRVIVVFLDGLLVFFFLLLLELLVVLRLPGS